MFVPKYPYLVQETTKNQFEQTECPSVGTKHYCTATLTLEDNCTLQLLTGKELEGCQILEVHVSKKLPRTIS